MMCYHDDEKECPYFDVVFPPCVECLLLQIFEELRKK